MRATWQTGGTLLSASIGVLACLTVPVPVVGPAASGRALQVAEKTAQTSSTEPRPVLVELFTSEGCSSCPPADVLVKKMDALQPISGAQLIVLSEHVTYWDHDGWKDPNSSALLTARQDSYEAALRIKDLYTPQLIVDGTQSVQVGDAQKLTDTLQRAATEPKISVKIGDVSMDPRDPSVLRAHIEAAANPGQHSADVILVVALDHVESQVLRGENGGRHLVHVAVVRQLTKVGRLAKGKPFAQDVQVKIDANLDLKNIRLIAFVQESGPGKLLGATLRKPMA